MGVAAVKAEACAARELEVSVSIIKEISNQLVPSRSQAIEALERRIFRVAFNQIDLSGKGSSRE